MNRIGIRVNANEKIAMGHLMRCLSIARQLANAGQAVIFILSEPYARPLVLEHGFACACLDRVYKRREMELEELTALVRKQEISCLLIDAYDLSFAYMQTLKQICKTVYIDDLAHFEYPADILVHYNTADTAMSREEPPKDPLKKYLLGMRYAPLREEFSGDGIKIKKQATQILITTGGTDTYHMTEGILERVGGCSNLTKHAVSGKFSKNVSILQEMAKNDDSIRVYHDIPDMHRVMQTCDLAVSAGGGTLAELCACGVPTVCFAVADNQLPGIHAYVNAGIMVYAGDVRQSREDVIRRAVHSIRLLADDYPKRLDMGRKAKRFVDGKGAGRIAQEIMHLISAPIPK